MYVCSNGRVYKRARVCECFLALSLCFFVCFHTRRSELFQNNVDIRYYGYAFGATNWFYKPMNINHITKKVSEQIIDGG